MQASLLTGLFPLLLVVCGAGLMVGAWPLIFALPSSFYFPLHISYLFLWTVGTLSIMTLCRRAGTSRWRYWPVLLCFIITLFLPNNPRELEFNTTLVGRNYRFFAFHTAGMIGFVLFLTGMMMHGRAHAWLLKAHALMARARRIPGRLFIWGICLCFLLIVTSLSWYCYKGLPAYDDSLAQFIHSNFMAKGRLYWDAHPLYQFFRVKLVYANADGKWFSQYQPLHVMLLSVGQWFDKAWLVNPISATLTLAATYAIARRLAGKSVAMLAAILFLGCQFILFMSSEFMNHSTALLFTTLFIWGYVELLHRLPSGQSKTTLLIAFATGLCLGCIFLTRPLTAVGVSLPFIAHALYLTFWKRSFPCFQSFLLLSAGGLLCLGFQAWYNVQLTGDPFTFPYNYKNTRNIPMFNKDHSLSRGLYKAQEEWWRANRWMFEWSIPSLLFLALACLRPLNNTGLRLLLAVIISCTIVDIPNRFNSSIYGPRYIYETSTCVLILTAIGIASMPRLLAAWRIPAPRPEAIHVIMGMALLLLFTGSLLFRFPPNLNVYSSGYFHNAPWLYPRLLAQAKTPALIFIAQGEKDRFYKVAFTLPPTDDSPVIVARDLGREKNRKLIEYYSNRNPYFERNGRLYPMQHQAPSAEDNNTIRPPDAAATPPQALPLRKQVTRQRAKRAASPPTPGQK